MNSQISNILAQTPNAIQQCLSDVPFCQVQFDKPKKQSGPISPALTGRFLVRKRRIPFKVTLKTNGQPRYVREAAFTFQRSRSANPKLYGIFVAPYISEEAAQILQSEGLGYVDLSGNCRLCFDDVFISRLGNSNLFSRRRDQLSLYAPKTERILRVLLQNTKRSWKGQELAKEAIVSVGQVSSIKRRLEEREWIVCNKAGIRLAKPDKLLEEWKQNYDLARSTRRDYFTLDTVDRFEQRLAAVLSKTGNLYAYTAFSAAARLAPAVRYQRVYAYVSGNLNTLARELELKPVESGANVTLIEPYDEGVYLGSSRSGTDVRVSPVQAYLDLTQLRGRGDEAAEALMREVLEPAWR